MDVGVVVLRLIHISCGVFWAGTLVFVALFLEPSVREAGPNGASVMQGLMRRRFLTVMPIVAALTILSGIDLLRRASAGFAGAWFGSPQGVTLTAGAVAAVVAFAIGLGIMRPAVLRVGKLVQEAQHAADLSVKGALQAQVEGLRRRARRGGRWVAVLLTVAVITMAAARYLG